MIPILDFAKTLSAARDVENAPSRVAEVKRLIESAECDAGTPAHDVIGKNRVVPGVACSTMDDGKRSGRKRNAHEAALTRRRVG